MIQDSTIIFTDGSSRGNPGPGGFSAVIVLPKNNDGSRISADKKLTPIDADKEGEWVAELGGGEKHTTNNRMEIMAAISALKYLKSYQLSAISYKFFIYSDSAYLISGITKWIHGWKKKGWITSAKEPVENRDLWEILDSLVSGKNLEWKYVGGHVGILGNERCDEIATAFAEGNQPKLYSGLLANYPIKNILDISADSLKEQTKHQTKNRSNQKAFSYVSLVDRKIEIYQTWSECEKRVKGVSGAKYKKSLSAEDEAKIIQEWKSPPV